MVQENRSLFWFSAVLCGYLLGDAAHAGGEFIAYIADLTSDSIVRLYDANGDGDYNDAGETARFFGPGNADGWLGVGSAQGILVLGEGDVLAADGEDSGGYETRVYRLRDMNGDGDAMDQGEATEWWDSILPTGVNYDRPKEILRGPDGAFYLADNNTINFDNDTPEAIWRLEDLNMDGDVNDAGEVTLALELAPAGDSFAFITEDFKFDSSDRLWWSNLSSSSNDTNVWYSDDFGPPVPWASDTDILGIDFKETGMTLHPSTENPMFQAVDVFNTLRIIELIDVNGNGMIDDIDEVKTWYRNDIAASVVQWDFNNSLNVDFAPDGSLWLLDLANQSVLRFIDANEDGDYNDSGEAMQIYDGAAADYQMEFVRTVGFAELPAPCPADIAGDDDTVNVFDLLELLAGWGSNAPGADLAAPADVIDVFDLLELLAQWGPCS